MSHRKKPDATADPYAVTRIDAELEDDLGREVPAEEAVRALAGTPTRGATMLLRANWLLVLLTFATAVVVGAIVSLAVGSWLLLGVAVVVHGIATAIVIAT